MNTSMSPASAPQSGILGLHHVTAISSAPQANVDFYTDTLGLRLVKKTVNFDDPGVYHLYYGDEQGSPGTILTFFPWPNARRGQRGVGQVAATAFAVPVGSLDAWAKRLESQGLVAPERQARFGEEVLTVLDPDGLLLEIIATAHLADRRPSAAGAVAAEIGLHGLAGTTLHVATLDHTARLLEEMGLEHAAEDGARHRFSFAASQAEREEHLDVVVTPGQPAGRVAAGTVHHIAFRVVDDEAQLSWREKLLSRGLSVSEVRDRQYFRSIYFREPGGVLFEIATDPPGFGVDEELAELGTSLRLPPWLENRRIEIEAGLPELDLSAALTSSTESG